MLRALVNRFGLPGSRRKRFVVLLAGALSASSAYGQAGWPPEEAIKKLHVADGLRLELFAAEPMVRQPVTMTIDERDRVWVIQYLQYPEPAGLNKVAGDRYDRIRYDRVPKPPPHGPKGADRITILEDLDGDGRADRADDFVTGLNLASGLALGHGGVWVLQSPYLLFYPDEDADDHPDRDPDVRLIGFGLDDAHSVANSLQWGPDGWLYGVHGSTVNANVRGIGFQQGIWRYHPRSDRFELFSEGGGNTYGLDFDRFGNAIAGTNWGVTGLHQMQGAYHIKNFGKHGALHNPYAFGFFEHMPHDGAPVGKLSVGGVFYQARQWPKRFTDQFVTANPLNHAVYAINVLPHGSTFSTRFQERVMWSDDAWFQPVDLALDVDGSLLVADWYDGNINYQITYRNRDNFDARRGRIYRILAESTPASDRGSRGRQSHKQLSEELFHPNIVRARRAMQSLAEDGAGRLADDISVVLDESIDERRALHALWAMNLCSDLTKSEELAVECLQHRFASVRSWSVRLLGDDPELSHALAEQIAKLARHESDIRVRAQLACTAKRLDGKYCLPIVMELAQRDGDAEDAYLPMLLWWALESKSISDRKQVLEWLSDAKSWRTPLVRDTIIPRLARRYAAEGTDAGFAACGRLIIQAPTESDAQLVLGGIEHQLQGLRFGSMPNALQAPLARLWERGDPPLALVLCSLRMGSSLAFDEAIARIGDSSVAAKDRVSLIKSLGEAGKPDAVPAVTNAFKNAESDAIQSAALSALARYQDPTIGSVILESYHTLNAKLRDQARQTLYSRSGWSRQLLNAIDQGDFNMLEVRHRELLQLSRHPDAAVQELMKKHWGTIRLETSAQKRERMVDLRRILATGTAERGRGKMLFHQVCGKCHKLHGEGHSIGPDLTPYPRQDLSYLLLHSVDPSAVIRPAYQAVILSTEDGRVLTGLLAETSPKTITILTAENLRIRISRNEIDQIDDSPLSLMPEKLFGDLGDQQLRDLFSYLQSSAGEPLDGG